MSWTVCRPLRVKRNGEYLTLQAGADLPEFDEWPHQHIYLSQGKVKWTGAARTTDAPAPKRRGRPPKVRVAAEAG